MAAHDRRTVSQAPTSNWSKDASTGAKLNSYMPGPPPTLPAPHAALPAICVGSGIESKMFPDVRQPQMTAGIGRDQAGRPQDCRTLSVVSFTTRRGGESGLAMRSTRSRAAISPIAVGPVETEVGLGRMASASATSSKPISERSRPIVSPQS